MGTLWRDLRYSLRVLAKVPGFTAVIVLTLALGIGANSTIFSWINATLLNPIPGISHADEIFQMGNGGTGDADPFSYPDILDMGNRGRSFSGVTGFAIWPISLTGNANPEHIWGTLVTANYFEVLGVKPVLGRGFLPTDDNYPNGAPVAVVSYGIWQDRFGGSPAVLGRTIHIDERPYTIIGVAPRVFQGSYTGLRSEVWVPVTMAPQLMTWGKAALTSRDSNWMNALVRLRPGVSREAAQAELTTLLQQIARQYPQSHAGQNQVTLFPLWRAPFGANYFFSTLLPVLMALAGLVLLLACANLANLLLTHNISRRKEIGVRLALGASRARLFRQLLIENLLLSLAGGGLALCLTLWADGSFMGLMPASNLPIWISMRLDRRVLLVTVFLSIITALISGMLPALRASRMNPIDVLKDESTGVAGGRHKTRLSSGLAVAQIALSVLLLVAAGLFIRSFRAAQRFNPGFNAKGVLLESYDLFSNGYSEAQGVAFDREILGRVEALPGVRVASIADWTPLAFSNNTDSFTPEGYTSRSHNAISAGVVHVSPGYFSTMEIPLLEGRDFTPEDSANSQPVVIISKALANRYWAHQDAVGKRMKIDGKMTTVVGVARTTNYYDLNEKPQPFLYLPLYEFYSANAILHVRTAGEPLAASRAVEETIHRFDPDLPVFDITTLKARIESASFVQRLAGMFVGVFGMLAFVLATLGIYGVISYSTEQRAHEIGIRLALGAGRRDVLRLVLGHGAKLALGGVVIGVSTSLALTRLIRSMLFGVSATDPVTFVCVVTLLSVTVMAACYLPARRAAHVDPITVLHQE